MRENSKWNAPKSREVMAKIFRKIRGLIIDPMIFAIDREFPLRLILDDEISPEARAKYPIKYPLFVRKETPSTSLKWSDEYGVVGHGVVIDCLSESGTIYPLMQAEIGGTIVSLPQGVGLKNDPELEVIDTTLTIEGIRAQASVVITTETYFISQYFGLLGKGERVSAPCSKLFPDIPQANVQPPKWSSITRDLWTKNLIALVGAIEVDDSQVEEWKKLHGYYSPGD